MQNFIVLGIIPGTDYQTTFTFWLMVTAGLLLLPITFKLWRKRYAILAYMRVLRAARLINRLQIPA